MNTLQFSDHLVPYEMFIKDLASQIVRLLKEDSNDPEFISQRKAFELFCPNKDERVSAKNAAVAYNGNVTNTQVGDRVVDGSLAVANIQITSLQNELDTLKKSNATLHNNLEDKERIIAMKQEKIDMMQKVMDLMQEKIDALEGR